MRIEHHPRFLDRLKRHEGLRLEAYVCPAGALTIGYGHNLDQHPIPNVGDEGDRISRAEADKLLHEIEKEGLFSTIEQGKFGGVKRPRDGGKGLEGVCVKDDEYFNPFIPLMLGGAK